MHILEKEQQKQREQAAKKQAVFFSQIHTNESKHETVHKISVSAFQMLQNIF